MLEMTRNHPSAMHHPAAPTLSAAAELATMTIDLDGLFTEDVQSTGTFDLRSLGSTSLGMLMDAMPMPALLIDRCFFVVFVNQACAKLSTQWNAMQGRPFADLVPQPKDADRAKALANKTLFLLEGAFKTRMPQISEAILQFDRKRAWCRLHLRSVRIHSQRYLFLIVEDLTAERTQQALSAREEKRMRQANEDLKTNLRQQTERAQSLAKRLKLEENRTRLMRKALLQEQQKVRTISRLAPIGSAILGRDGVFRDVCPRFKRIFGYDATDIPSMAEWLKENDQRSPEASNASKEWFDAFADQLGDKTAGATLSLTCKDGTKKKVAAVFVALDEDEFLMACREDRQL